jgi:hypothetical protein
VPKEFLNRSQIGATLQQVRRKGVPKGMGEGSKPRPNGPADASSIKRAAPHPEPKCIPGLIAGEGRPAARKITIDGGSSVPGQRHDPVSVSLAPDPNEIDARNVVDCERSGLRYPETGAVQELEQRPVTKIDRIGTVELVEDLGERSSGEGARQDPASLGGRGALRRVVGHQFAMSGIAEERPHRRGLPSHRAPCVAPGRKMGEIPPHGFAVDRLDGSVTRSPAEIEELR